MVEYHKSVSRVSPCGDDEASLMSHSHLLRKGKLDPLAYEGELDQTAEDTMEYLSDPNEGGISGRGEMCADDSDQGDIFAG